MVQTIKTEKEKKGKTQGPRRDSAVGSHEKKVDNNDRKYKGHD